MLQLKVIVGSTRTGRAADWSFRGSRSAYATMRASTSTCSTCGAGRCRCFPSPTRRSAIRAIPTYSNPIVKRWNKTIAAADAYLFVTPEYNHSVPPALKNAVDSVFASFAFRNKPCAVVAYSGGAVGGARAVEHLA